MRILSADEARRKAHGLLQRAHERHAAECDRGAVRAHYLGYLRERMAALEYMLARLDSAVPGEADDARWALTIMGDV